MASKRSLGGGIKIPQGGGAIPNYGGGNALMNMIAAQSMKTQSREQAPQNLGEGALATKSVGENVTYESPNARMFTADAQNQLTRIKQLKTVAKNLEDLAMGLPTDLPTAGLEYAGAKLTGGRFGSEGTKTYLDALPAASAGIYRAITGDNRLSDQDAAARAKPLFWHPLEGQNTREGKFSFLNYMMDEAERNVSPTAPQTDLESMARFQRFLKGSTDRFKQGQQPSVQMVSEEGRIKVRDLATGKTGTISASKFNEQKYARI